MKTGYILLIFAVAIGLAVAVGYFLRKPDTQIITETQYVTDYKQQVKIDSFEFVDSIKTRTIAKLKLKLSKFGAIPAPGQPPIIDTAKLPCDTGNILGQLREDLASWQEISTIQDTINAEAGRFNVYLKNQLYKKDTAIYKLHERHNEIAKKIHNKNNLIFAESGIIAALVIILLL